MVGLGFFTAFKFGDRLVEISLIDINAGAVISRNCPRCRIKPRELLEGLQRLVIFAGKPVQHAFYEV